MRRLTADDICVGSLGNSLGQQCTLGHLMSASDPFTNPIHALTEQFRQFVGTEAPLAVWNDHMPPAFVAHQLNLFFEKKGLLGDAPTET